eukprot:SAG31_NODE_138_length_22877_cov_29.540917_19_plen_269_part_00
MEPGVEVPTTAEDDGAPAAPSAEREAELSDAISDEALQALQCTLGGSVDLCQTLGVESSADLNLRRCPTELTTVCKIIRAVAEKTKGFPCHGFPCCAFGSGATGEPDISNPATVLAMAGSAATDLDVQQKQKLTFLVLSIHEVSCANAAMNGRAVDNAAICLLAEKVAAGRDPASTNQFLVQLSVAAQLYVAIDRSCSTIESVVGSAEWKRLGIERWQLYRPTLRTLQRIVESVTKTTGFARHIYSSTTAKRARLAVRKGLDADDEER